MTLGAGEPHILTSGVCEEIRGRSFVSLHGQAEEESGYIPGAHSLGQAQ